MNSNNEEENPSNYNKYNITHSDYRKIIKFISSWDKFLGLGTDSRLLTFLNGQSGLKIPNVFSMILNRGGTELNRKITENFMFDALTNKYYCKEYPWIINKLSTKEINTITSKSKIFKYSPYPNLLMTIIKIIICINQYLMNHINKLINKLQKN